MLLDPKACYRAVRARDRRFDGRFFVGVSSTKIYCRPICPVRQPKRQNMRFYSSAAAAEGDTYADVRNEFAGHEICDSDSWLHSVDIFSISSSYHPTAAGQELGYLPAFTSAAR